MSSGNDVFSVWKGRRRARKALLGAIVFMVFLIAASAVFASGPDTPGGMSTLVNKLVKKGVLSKDDANAVLAGSKGQNADSNLPGWLKRLTINGDFRLRYEYIDVEGQPVAPINRGRFRYRLNLADQVNNNFKVVFGLASDGGHSRSANVTFANNFSGKPVRIDQAYVQYSIPSILTVTGGKAPVPLWTTTQFVWDWDLRPEGVFAALTPPASGDVDFFLNTDFFILNQIANPKETEMPFMVAFQPGADWKFAENGKLRVAATYYVFNNLKKNYKGTANLPGSIAPSTIGATLFPDNNTNDTLDANGNLAYNYNDLHFAAEADFNKLSDALPYAAVYGEYIYNPAPSTSNVGYIAGLRFGDPSVSNSGQWQVEYNYRRLERNAWIDILPEDDFLFGATNVEGHKASITYGIAKNVSTALTWFNPKQIEPNAPNKTTYTENTVQVDLMLSF